MGDCFLSALEHAPVFGSLSGEVVILWLVPDGGNRPVGACLVPPVGTGYSGVRGPQSVDNILSGVPVGTWSGGERGGWHLGP